MRSIACSAERFHHPAHCRMLPVLDLEPMGVTCRPLAPKDFRSCNGMYRSHKAAMMVNMYSKKFLGVPRNEWRRHLFSLVRNEGEGT
jgi:hypothetical protein